MFAIVRTGGKQYRVAPGDKIVVEKLAGDVGTQVALGDVLWASGGEATPAVTAEVLHQSRGDKIVVFKKKRRHNYRRKQGHRQHHTVLRIMAVGDARAEDRATASVTPEPATNEPMIAGEPTVTNEDALETAVLTANAE